MYMDKLDFGFSIDETADFVKSLDLTNKSGMGLSKANEKKFIEAFYYDEMVRMQENNAKYQNTITDSEWIYLIENHDHLSTTLELLEWKKKANFISWHLYNVICSITKLEVKIREGKATKFDNSSMEHCIKCLKDGLAPNTVKFLQPNKFIRSLAQTYLDRLRPSHRPAKLTIIKMIDAETDEVIDRFEGRAAVMEATGIKKSQLSKCIKSAKEFPNCKTKWKTFKLEGRKYYFIEVE